MLVHSVYFWLKKDMSEEEIQKFKQGLEGLMDIKSVESGYFGSPVKSDRPVVDSSYDFGLTIINKDLDAQNEYQVDPIHEKFVSDFGKYFEKVLVYDFQ